MRWLRFLRWYGAGAALGVLLLVGSSLTWAAFFATTANTGNSFSAAANFCVSPGTTSVVNPDGDSYVDKNSPASNFGNANTISINKHGNKTQRIYVHFALPTPPHNCSVTSAVLRLNCSSANTGQTLLTYRANTTWTEAGITWNNQPGSTGSSTSAAAGTGWVSWTVTSQTQSLYSGTNTGFLIQDSAEGGGNAIQDFNSREAGSNKPDLTVTWG